MVFEIIFQPDGRVILPDLPSDLFPVAQELGRAIPTPKAEPDSQALPGCVQLKNSILPLEKSTIRRVATKTLWRVHDSDQPRLQNNLVQAASRLDIKVELARRSLLACDLCEWRCGINRWHGEVGICGSKSQARVVRSFLNWSEESTLIPGITIDLSGCNWHCAYCQYPQHMSPGAGLLLHPRQLAHRIEQLWNKGGSWLHWVGGNPDQHLWEILRTLQVCPANIPIVWNSNGWASETTLRLLDGVVDVHLVDLRHANPSCAEHYDAPPESFAIITRNLLTLNQHRAKLIVRHLQLPGHFECCTIPILHWLAENLPSAGLNLMNGQFHPAHLASQFPEINRCLSKEEHYKAEILAAELGLKRITGG